MAKYFSSIQKVNRKKAFETVQNKRFIICTNAGFDFEDLNRNGFFLEETTEELEVFDELKKRHVAMKKYKLSGNIS